MRLRATVWPLSLAAVLIGVPLSFEWIIAVVGPFVTKVLWQSVETIGLAQLAIVAFFTPIILVTKIGERWPRVGQAIAVAAIVAAVVWWIASDASMPASQCVQGWCGGPS